MNLSLNQTKLVGLTMQLDLKAKEYKNLCEKLDIIKADSLLKRLINKIKV
ncbi:hypothetical protein [uncultured Clostridium sp.]|nr:hypothetical protein [uncultured Clostridium sp.]